MGELFRHNQPESALAWTGERMVTGLVGPIEAEHFHRYFLARELCRGKDVLDVASGEGYGSAFLAQTARHVIGVDVDSVAVDHAAHAYRSANLHFLKGEATKLPVEDCSVDAVVSFETIEHLSDHEAFLAEVKRVLRPDGFLIVSTPDMNVYSARGTDANPFHVRELTKSEFRAKLSAVFPSVSLFRQRAITGSTILPDTNGPEAGARWIYEQRDSTTFECDRKLLRAPFLIAVASDRPVLHIDMSLYIQTVNVTDIASDVKAELSRLRAVEEAAREQASILATAVSDAAAVPALEAELARLRNTAIPALETEMARLRDVEADVREKAPIFAKAVSDATAVPVFQAELARLREVEVSACEQIQTLTEERGQVREDTAILQRQLDTAVLLARQQALAVQRSQKELLSAREETDRYKSAYDESALLARRKIEELDKRTGRLQAQLVEATQSLNKERSTSSERIQLLQNELADVRQTLGLIESSTAWKLASRVHSVFQNYPRFRLYARRIARLIWWTVTFQLVDRIRARRRLFKMRDMIANSTLFDAAWYVSQYAGIAEAGRDPALHYALYGATERRNPGPRFDAEAYLLRYPDVAEAGANPLIDYLEHGATEGRVISSVDAPPVATEVPAEVPRHDYHFWVSCYDTIKDDDRAAIIRHIELRQNRPLISVVMPVYNTKPLFLRKALDSLLSQLYPDWELCIADDASTDPAIRQILNEYTSRDQRIKVVFRSTNGHISAASNSALALATGSYVALLDHDDELSPHALYMVAVALDQHPDTDIIYSDEDRIDESGTRLDPHFKPQWNLELFHSYNVLNHLGVYRTSLVRSLSGFREGFEGSQDYDLALRIVDSTRQDRIVHIPHILYHWRTIASTFSTTNLQDAVDAGRRALAEHFERRGENVRLVEGSKPYITRVIRPVPDPPPLVSLIIPTRDRFELLRTCVEGLLHRTDYPNMEILIVDNESQELETLQYFQSLRGNPRIKILEVPGPFNFSALNNLAVAAAAGEIIGFINNDIEVIEPGWLTEMVSQVAQPGVGAVGAKLLYPDGRIQHAGVIVGLGGVAGHSHKYFPRYDFGYFCRLQLSYNVSCVTAACMLVPKKVFEEVGGFDEVNLTVAFNDVDLCLKIRDAGYTIIWTPYAELYHHESASRGSDEAPEKLERAAQEQEYMKKRWGDLLLNDPYYNPNLTLEHENYSIAFPPRASKPWLSPIQAPALTS